MKKKTHRFTLIEVIIATSLFSILIFSISSLFFKYQKIKVKIDSIRPKVFERVLFYEKIFEMMASIDKSTIKTSSPYYNQFLSFDFNNGYKDDAAFSGKVHLELYRTFEKNLMMKLINDEKQEKKTPLLKDITSFSYEINKNTIQLNLNCTNQKELNYTFSLPQGGP